MNNTTPTTTTSITLNIPVSLLPSPKEMARKFVSTATIHAYENDLECSEDLDLKDATTAILWTKDTFFPNCVPDDHDWELVVQGAREDGEDIIFLEWFIEDVLSTVLDEDTFTNTLRDMCIDGVQHSEITLPRLGIQFDIPEFDLQYFQHTGEGEDELFAILPFHHHYWPDGTFTASTMVIGRDDPKVLENAFTVWFEDLHDPAGQPEDSNDSGEGHIIRGIKLEDLDTAIEDVFLKFSDNQ